MAEANGGSQDGRPSQINPEESSGDTPPPPNRPLQPRRPPRQMRKVLPQLESKGVYDPVIVALGPYNHGEGKLSKAEEFKEHCVKWFTANDAEKRNLFSNAIKANIKEFRGCYADQDTNVDKYDDERLMEMMLRDGCFILNLMANRSKWPGGNFSLWIRFFGSLAAYHLTLRDIMLLENQIPFKVLRTLLSVWDDANKELPDREQARNDANEGGHNDDGIYIRIWTDADNAGDDNKKHGQTDLIVRFLNWLLTGDTPVAAIPAETEDPPLHFLEACRTLLVEQFKTPPNQQRKKTKNKNEDKTYHEFHACGSVTDLKAKGIVVALGPTHSLKDIKFKSNLLGGKLHLPFCSVHDRTPVMFSNLIAYEVSPYTRNDYTVLSYVNFMKSLIQTPEDVKELQIRGVMSNTYSNREQAVDLFRNIDTLGLINLDIFSDVREEVEKHCRCKRKTWKADLMHTHFESPWSVIKLAGAILLLFLASVQTFFTAFHRH